HRIAEAVVDPLEAADVDTGEGHGFETEGAVHLFCGELIKSMAVGQAGQKIDDEPHQGSEKRQMNADSFRHEPAAEENRDQIEQQEVNFNAGLKIEPTEKNREQDRADDQAFLRAPFHQGGEPLKDAIAEGAVYHPRNFKEEAVRRQIEISYDTNRHQARLVTGHRTFAPTRRPLFRLFARPNSG